MSNEQENEDFQYYDDQHDKYYDEIEDILDYYWDEKQNIPEKIYIAELQKWKGIDLDSVIESITENDIPVDESYDFFNSQVVDLKELENFIKEWNKKQTLGWYSPNFDRIIMLKETQEYKDFMGAKNE